MILSPNRALVVAGSDVPVWSSEHWKLITGLNRPTVDAPSWLEVTLYKPCRYTQKGKIFMVVQFFWILWAHLIHEPTSSRNIALTIISYCAMLFSTTRLWR